MLFGALFGSSMLFVVAPIDPKQETLIFEHPGAFGLEFCLHFLWGVANIHCI